jgi:TRAP transporter TAXI family solute receptor
MAIQLAIQERLRQHWALFAFAVAATAAVAAGFAVFWTMPPRTIVMATGAEGGGYHEIGKRYQEILAREGVRLRLVPTGGAIANLALLRDRRSGVSVALIQGGTTSEKEAPEIESLGTVFYEPLWVFRRADLDGTGLGWLRGRRVSVGAEGSGTRVLSLALLKRHGIDDRNSQLFGYSPQQAGENLLAGELDAALFLISWDSPIVRKLLADPRVELASLPNIDAYVALYPFLNKVVVPAGVGDLVNNRPPADMTMFAPKASLVVRRDVHSAIQFLLLNAAAQIHSSPGIFQRAGQFPAAEGIDAPLSAEAIQFYKSGRPFLQNYMPFWAASLVTRLFVVLLPILGILYPLMRFLPAIYGWMMRRKISRLYGELRFLEDDLAARTGTRDRHAMNSRLDELELEANRLRIPAAYASMLYVLRHHIDLVRQRLATEAAQSPR